MPSDCARSVMRDSVLELLRSAGKPLTLKVEGRCMSPFLASGDAVRIVFCEAEKLSIGDIVAYRTNDGVAVHRVLRKARNGGSVRVYQKGDNLRAGFWVGEDQVLGRVVSVLRPDGRHTSVPCPSIWIRAACSARYFQIVLRGYSRQFLSVLRKA